MPKSSSKKKGADKRSKAKSKKEAKAAMRTLLARSVVIPAALVDEARAALDANTSEWAPSLLYETATATKISDETRRVSEFRAIADDGKLWAACEKIVSRLSAEDQTYAFALVRNDATHLRYRAGGFFKTHQDYLSLTSNAVDEYTLLLSVNTYAQAGEARGGATRVYREAGGSGGGDVGEAYDTTAPGAALLFRKDLDHEGERVDAGEKHLLSLNLLGFRKSAARQVLLVECGDDAAPAEAPQSGFAFRGSATRCRAMTRSDAAIPEDAAPRPPRRRRRAPSNGPKIAEIRRDRAERRAVSRDRARGRRDFGGSPFSGRWSSGARRS